MDKNKKKLDESFNLFLNFMSLNQLCAPLQWIPYANISIRIDFSGIKIFTAALIASDRRGAKVHGGREKSPYPPRPPPARDPPRIYMIQSSILPDHFLRKQEQLKYRKKMKYWLQFSMKELWMTTYMWKLSRGWFLHVSNDLID